MGLRGVSHEFGEYRCRAVGGVGFGVYVGVLGLGHRYRGYVRIIGGEYSRGLGFEVLEARL